MNKSAFAALNSPLSTNNFLPVFGYDLLSVLLGRSVGTLQADRCRKPHTLPPACTPPGTKSPLWLLSDVLAWLESHREDRAPALPATHEKQRGRGAPRKRKAERGAI